MNLRAIAKKEFRKLGLPPGEANTMLAWEYYQKGFNSAWEILTALLQTAKVPNQTWEDWIKRIREMSVLIENKPKHVDVDPVPFQFADNKNKISAVGYELLFAHGIVTTDIQLVNTWGVTGDETPLEIWELSERIKKSQDGQV